MLFRAIGAERGLCCDARCGIGVGWGEEEERAETDVVGLEGTYGGRREEKRGSRSRANAPRHTVSVCFSIIQVRLGRGSRGGWGVCCASAAASSRTASTRCKPVTTGLPSPPIMFEADVSLGCHSEPAWPGSVPCGDGRRQEKQQERRQEVGAR